MGSIQPVPLFHLIKDEEAPTYDGLPTRRARHVTVIQDAPVDDIGASLGLAALGLYSHMERRANAKGIAYGSYQDIADATKTTRRHLIRVMDLLIDGGWIAKAERTTSNGFSRSNEWFLPHHLQRTDRGDRDSDTNGDIDSDTTPPTYVTPKVVSSSPKVDNSNDGVNPLPPNVDPPNDKPEDKPKRKAEPVEPSAEFLERLWSAYPKNGRGNRAESFGLWEAMTPEDRDAAVAALPLFAASRDWLRGYSPGAQVWLRNRRWLDPPQPEVPSLRDQLNANRPAEAEHVGGITDAFMDELRQKRLARQAGRTADGPDVIPTTGYVIGDR